MLRIVVPFCLVSAFVAVSILAAGCGDGARDASAAASQRAQTFDEFAVLWAGDSVDFEGDDKGAIPLADARRVISPASQFHPAVESFRLSYGTCEIEPGRTSCPTPVQIVIFSACATPELAEHVKDRAIDVRGVEASLLDQGTLWVETADFTASLGVAGYAEKNLELTLELADLLVGANEKAQHLDRGSDFRPKSERACP